MKYLVMECHLSYAVVLDENGRFLKVANRHYEVGQTVTNIIEMRQPQAAPRKQTNRWAYYSVAAMAACLVLMMTALFQMDQKVQASVYMTINPEVRIDVNRRDVVVGLGGVNADGRDLLEGYDYKRKDLDLVMDELVDRAIELGYLHEGGRITLSLDADEDWVVSHTGPLNDHLSQHLVDKLVVTVNVEPKQAEPTAPSSSVSSTPIVIPLDPDDYGESDYGEEALDDGQTDYDDAPEDDGQTDYDDAPADDGQTDYDDTPEDDAQTDYAAPSIPAAPYAGGAAAAESSQAEADDDTDYDSPDEDDDEDDDDDEEDGSEDDD